MNSDQKGVYKVIRDSVHGNIELDKSFVENILDTPYFQRLRRIEQTSVRAIYPCARHDRFTHSLGVYHVGTKIIDHLLPQLNSIDGLKDIQSKTITHSYKIACLLHDIAHAPFSHTFESYYGDKAVLYKQLCENFNNKELIKNRLKIGECKEHELASAILVADKFKDAIQTPNLLGGDVELVCRMIIGAPYDEDTVYYQVCNCFIKLLHGEVDADRLDYACRDIWSSGYKSVSIDINRVIHAMHIKKYEGKYQLCFSHNVVGDIRNIMELKRFQVSHIFNHHTIVYDQALLIQAAETMAKDYFPNEGPSLALQNIICLQAVKDEKAIKNASREHALKLLGDDDLYFLIKQSNNTYFQELSSRTYKRFALWKSPEEFFTIFPDIDKTINISNKNFGKKIKAALKPLKKDLIDDIDIFTHEVTYKERASIDDLLIVVHGDVKPYRDVRHEIFKETSGSREFKFTYLYIPRPKKPEPQEEFDKIRARAIDLIKPVLDELFKPIPAKPDTITKIKNYLIEAGCKVDISKTKFTKGDITQFKKVFEKIKERHNVQITKVAIELLTFIISTYEEEEKEKERKKRTRKVLQGQATPFMEMERLNQELAEEYAIE